MLLLINSKSLRGLYRKHLDARADARLPSHECPRFPIHDQVTTQCIIQLQDVLSGVCLPSGIERGEKRRAGGLTGVRIDCKWLDEGAQKRNAMNGWSGI